MPGLLIKELPPALHRRLKKAAAQHHRSMTREALSILEEGLSRSEPSVEWPLPLRGRIRLTKSFIDRAKRTGRP